MPKAKPVVLRLTQQEAQELLVPVGNGGHQAFHHYIRSQLQGGNLAVTFDDENLGKLIRYMTQYGQGGFQARLQRAFSRSLCELLDCCPDPSRS